MDRFSLLCEECGYSLAGLSENSACPECGRPLRRSLPEARAGSAWQQRPGVANWLRTNWQVLRSPVRQFSSIRIEKRTGTGLLTLNTLVTAAFFIDPWVGVIVGDPARGARAEGGLYGWMVVCAMWFAETLAAAGFLWILTFVEFLGVQFFSRRRGWRLTPEGAWQVCCHASVGWLLLGVLPMLTLAAFQALLRLFHIAPSGTVSSSLCVGPGSLSWGDVTYGAGVLGAMAVGMMAFEILVYVGVRRCRYSATRVTVALRPGDPIAQVAVQPDPRAR